MSIACIPIKVRPGTNGKSATATSGLKNLGLNLDLWSMERTNYFANSEKTTHKLALGILVAPGVEELDSTLTAGKLEGDEKSRQLFISTGITLSYSYNKITFSFVPFGYDVGTSSIGNSLEQKRWWGFGIGVDPKIFSSVTNK